MSSFPALEWVIVRPGGHIVPLIPADELPPEVQLLRVPRNLSKSDLSGQKVEFIETAAPPVKFAYQLATQSSLTASVPTATTTPGAHVTHGFMAPDAMVRRELAKDVEKAVPTTFIRHAPPPSLLSLPGLHQSTAGTLHRESWRLRQSEYPATSAQSISDVIASSNRAAAERIGYYGSRHPPRSGVGPDPLKKVYCTFWIRTGECDYIQQGCIYKHEMPDLAKLKELGFKEVPRWWKEKTGIRVGSSAARPVVRDLSWMEKRFQSVRPDTHSDKEDHVESNDESDGPQNVTAIKASPLGTSSAKPSPSSKQETPKPPVVPLFQDIPELAPASPSSNPSESGCSTVTSRSETPLPTRDYQKASQRSKVPSITGDIDLLSFDDVECQSLDGPQCLMPSTTIRDVPIPPSRGVSQRQAPQDGKITESSAPLAPGTTRTCVSSAASLRSGRKTAPGHTEAASPPQPKPQDKRDRRFKTNNVPSEGLSTSKYAVSTLEPSEVKAGTVPSGTVGGPQVRRDHLLEAQRNAARHQQSHSSNVSQAPPSATVVALASTKKRGCPPCTSEGRKSTTPKSVGRKAIFVPATQGQSMAASAK
jgi:hypothetical protein